MCSYRLQKSPHLGFPLEAGRGPGGAQLSLRVSRPQSPVFSSNPCARGAVGPAVLSRRACATWRTRCKVSIAAESRSWPSQSPDATSSRASP